MLRLLEEMARGVKMTLGTKTLLFGVHQFILHPCMVLLAWVRLYRSLPSLREFICIIIHDWGYWGKPSLKCADGDTHPEYGARLAEKLFGPEYRDFIFGHSFTYTERNKIPASKLMAPDKYWHCMIPFWVYKLMAIPTGELKHYRDQNARQISKNQEEPDWVWWARFQIVCWEKAEGLYRIDNNKLDQ